MDIVKYMNRLEFSRNMDVSYFYKMDYVNIAEYQSCILNVLQEFSLTLTKLKDN